MNQGKVRIAADENGCIISISPNNPEYGYIRIEQEVNSISPEGWLRMRNRSTIIKGTIKDFQAANFSAGQELPGKIIVKESFQPFNTFNPDRNLKIAGTSGVICRVGDQPIYRETFYTQDPNAIDELIMHDNQEEIRQVNAANKLISMKFSVEADSGISL